MRLNERHTKRSTEINLEVVERLSRQLIRSFADVLSPMKNRRLRVPQWFLNKHRPPVMEATMTGCYTPRECCVSNPKRIEHEIRY